MNDDTPMWGKFKLAEAFNCIDSCFYDEKTSKISHTQYLQEQIAPSIRYSEAFSYNVIDGITCRHDWYTPVRRWLLKRPEQCCATDKTFRELYDHVKIESTLAGHRARVFKEDVDFSGCESLGCLHCIWKYRKKMPRTKPVIKVNISNAELLRKMNRHGSGSFTPMA